MHRGPERQIAFLGKEIHPPDLALAGLYVTLAGTLIRDERTALAAVALGLGLAVSACFMRGPQNREAPIK